MCVKKFIFSKFGDLQAYSWQLYYQMNCFTGIFQQHFKLPPCFDLIPLPIKFWGASPHVLNTCGKLCCWSYAKSLKQLISKLHLRKNIFSSLLLAYWRYKPCFCFFFWQIKMRNILHVGLILIISKVFVIFNLLCLCGNREYPGNFQNETVISKLYFQKSAQVKWEGRPFWSGQEV